MFVMKWNSMVPKYPFFIMVLESIWDSMFVPNFEHQETVLLARSSHLIYIFTLARLARILPWNCLSKTSRHKVDKTLLAFSIVAPKGIATASVPSSRQVIYINSLFVTSTGTIFH